MENEDMICPCCGRPKISLPLVDDNNNYQLKFDSEEDYDINFNDNNYNNFFNISNDPNYKCNEIEQKNIISNNSFSIDTFNFAIIDEKNDLTINTKKLGRKTKRKPVINPENNNDNNNDNNNINNSIVHDKFTDDNMKKKCKNIVLKCILEFINNKIKKLYNNDIGHGNSEKNLKTLGEESTKTTTAVSYRDFMKKKLKDIFSEKISTKYSNFSPEHNKMIIKSLIEEKDDSKKLYFGKLFNLTFEESEENGEEYSKYFAYYIKNYEKLINKKTKKLGKNSNET